MGTFEDIQAQLGTEFFERRSTRRVAQNWMTLCVCGHLAKYHAPSIDGEYRMVSTEPIVNRGEEWTRITVFDGCVGALKVRGFVEESFDPNPVDRVVTRTIHPTCPCDGFRLVARIDRPNRYWNQRVPIDREDFTRHPFQVGIRAFTTHLSKRRAALADPTWPAREFDRRFIWTNDRVCSISKCGRTDDVFPIYVGDRSELRCAQHR